MKTSPNPVSKFALPRIQNSSWAWVTTISMGLVTLGALCVGFWSWESGGESRLPFAKVNAQPDSPFISANGDSKVRSEAPSSPVPSKPSETQWQAWQSAAAMPETLALAMGSWLQVADAGSLIGALDSMPEGLSREERHNLSRALLVALAMQDGEMAVEVARSISETWRDPLSGDLEVAAYEAWSSQQPLAALRHSENCMFRDSDGWDAVWRGLWGRLNRVYCVEAENEAVRLARSEKPELAGPARAVRREAFLQRYQDSGDALVSLSEIQDHALDERERTAWSDALLESAAYSGDVATLQALLVGTDVWGDDVVVMAALKSLAQHDVSALQDVLRHLPEKTVDLHKRALAVVLTDLPADAQDLALTRLQTVTESPDREQLLTYVARNAGRIEVAWRAAQSLMPGVNRNAVEYEVGFAWLQKNRATAELVLPKSLVSKYDQILEMKTQILWGEQ